MNTVLEPSQDIPVTADTEVLVVGGGPAGLAASLGAARTGAETLLIERYGYVGGQATGGLVVGIPPARGQAADNPAVLIEPPGKLGVITNEIHRRLEAMGAAETDTAGRYWSWWFPEETKWLAARMLKETNVRCLFHATAGEVIVEEGVLKGIIVEGKSGPQAILAEQVVDATGDADIAARAGVPYVKGDGKGNWLPITLIYVLGGIDAETYLAWLNSHPPETAGSTTGPEAGFRSRMRQFRSGEFRGAHGKVYGADGTDPLELTRAESEARRVAMERLRWLRENVPGCEEAYFSYSAPQLGVRETRLIQGEYILKGDELQAGKVFPDHIGFIKEGKSVPYRALVPKKVDNLLVAGRPISQDHSAVEATRSIPPCFVTGFAAGVAAARSAAEGVEPRLLDVSGLQQALKDYGVIFPPGI